MATKIAVTGATGRLGHHLVDVLEERGHQVVPIARSKGVDVITGDGLTEALDGVDAIVDAATGPSPDQQEATDFFTTSARNLEAAAVEAGVKRNVLVSIIGIEKFGSGYNAAKLAQEQAVLAGAVPTRVLRAAQFHEFVEELLNWGRQGDAAYVPAMQTQVVYARTVAEELADLVVNGEPTGPRVEIAGPRAERLGDLARMVAEQRGESLQVFETTDYFPDGELYDSGAALPGPDAKLAGPTFEEWLKG
jgi:uncharacterized protein YbjT (DUF2867 family)